MLDSNSFSGAAKTHTAAGSESKLDAAGVDKVLGELIWSSWIDPTDAPEQVRLDAMILRETPGCTDYRDSDQDSIWSVYSAVSRD